jgi:large subunit ribosomal protein L10
MARAEKVAAVAELTERFQTSNGAVLAEYRGLTVAQLAELRRSLGEQATFTVVKNTLTKIAATEAGIATELGGLLSGPSAIAFVSGDVVEAAKGLRDFAKANPALVIKGGVIDGKSMSPREIERLADLQSREVLLAMLAGAMKASMANAAATMAALPTQMARLAGALAAKREAEQGPAQEASAGGATAQADTAQADTAQADTAQADTAQADTAQADTAQADTAQADTAQADTAQAETGTPNDEAVADAAAENDD